MLYVLRVRGFQSRLDIAAQDDGRLYRLSTPFLTLSLLNRPYDLRDSAGVKCGTVFIRDPYDFSVEWPGVEPIAFYRTTDGGFLNAPSYSRINVAADIGATVGNRTFQISLGRTVTACLSEVSYGSWHLSADECPETLPVLLLSCGLVGSLSFLSGFA